MKLSKLFIATIIFLLTFTACQPNVNIPQREITKMNNTLPPPIVIAHRGARSLAPENTLMAAQKAFDLGADMWELDVAVTYDGELVVIHDDTLKRTSNAPAVYPKQMPWGVRLFTLAELKKLDFGSWFIAQDPFGTIADGSVSLADQEKMKNIQIPTLEEALVFTKANHWRVNVEIKDLSKTPEDAVVVEKVMALIEKLEMFDSVIVSSFNHDYLVRAKKINPKVTTAALVTNGVSDPVALLTKLGAQAYNPGIDGIGDLSKIRLVRAAGLDVYVWTVNDETIMRKLIDAGVSGIFTDYPQRGLQILKENK